MYHRVSPSVDMDMFLPSVDMDMFLQSTFSDNCVAQVSHLHLVNHICRVSPQCRYGHVSSKYHFLRIMHLMYHICRVSPQCGYEHATSNDHFLRIVHHRYHIYRVSPVWLQICFFK